MRALILTAGPLAASSATKVALTQKIASASYFVLNGAAGTATANNICLSQTPGAAGALILNGSLATTNSVAGFGGTAAAGAAVAYIGATPQRIYITSVSDESNKSFVVVGTVQSPTSFGPGVVVTETITGPNASTASSVNLYSTIISITVSTGTTGAVTVGTYGTATLDKARQILFTPAQNDGSITYTVSGTDWNGDPISEVVTGVNNPTTATTVLSYLTITSILTSGALGTTTTVGTNGVCSSPWGRLDELAALAPTALQVDGSGTVNWTVQQSLNDPNIISNQLPTPTYLYSPASMNWVNHPDSNLVASTTTTGVQGNYAYAPKFARIVMNSNGGATAFATLTVLQNYAR